MSLCRHYVRELRRSVLIGTPDLENRSRRSSKALEAIGDISAGPSTGTEKEREQNAQMSAYLRDQPALSALHDSPQSSQERRARASTQLSSQAFTDSNSPEHAVAREDIRSSAEKILYTFLLPGAEREITLPGSITTDITTAIEEEGRDDPEVFDVAKDYVFQAMERDAFPGFLRARALGNLIPPTIIARLIVGLISMFGGFWTAFVLIFLNAPRRTRCWVRNLSYEIFNVSTALLTHSKGNSTIHHRRILPRVVPVLFGPHYGSPRPYRIYPLRLRANPRALCPQVTGQALHHRTGRHRLS